jgi:hypothetical protein
MKSLRLETRGQERVKKLISEAKPVDEAAPLPNFWRS